MLLERRNVCKSLSKVKEWILETFANVRKLGTMVTPLQ
jgi:hypothetical protein